MTGTKIQDWINQSAERVSFRQAVHTILVAITRSEALKTNMIMKGGILLALGYESTRYTKDIRVWQRRLRNPNKLYLSCC